ncbi:hypothetical protein F4861DRAFT_163363 [Xylaria intraflava]|nr:hypothetical protein F4861DRAFT_163363 [Xylaria intraflava]
MAVISLDSSAMGSAAQAPPPTKPPTCSRCGGIAEFLITKRSNRNGNVGRPYYKCSLCGKFLVFCDQRGNDPTNPECHCGHSSKRQISGRSKPVPGRVHYVCRLGRCNFYCAGKDEKGVDIVIDMDLVADLARLMII